MTPRNGELPFEFHGHLLVKLLGHGYLTDAFLAVTPRDSRLSLPAAVCMKIVINPCGAYTDESARAEIRYQRELLRTIDHALVIKTFPHALPDNVDDAMATELGICTIKDLQKAVDNEQDSKANVLPPAVVKYFAAQLFLAIRHLHRHNIRWGDPKQANVVIMKDFTLRLIDVGDKEAKPEKAFIDFCYTAAIINNMITSSSERFVQQKPPYYHDLLKRFKDELGPSLYDLLSKLLAYQPLEELLSHPYWSEIINGDPATSINLAESGLDAVYNMRESAWKALPLYLRQWFLSMGGEDPHTSSIIEYPTRSLQASDVGSDANPRPFPDCITSFPAAFQGHKLLKLLGRGYLTDAYLAELAADSELPSLICMKIITSSRNSDWYTCDAATKELKYQGDLLKTLDHPLIVKCFGELFEGHIHAIATEAGVCSLEQFQGFFNPEVHFRANTLPAVTVKYFAAQLFAGVAYLHRMGVVWGSAKQSNVVIMPDFTIRIIDIGKSTPGAEQRKWKDSRFVVGIVINLLTSSEDDFQNSIEFYEGLLDRFRDELGSALHDLLRRLLQEELYEALLSHPYWSNSLEDVPNTAVDLTQGKNDIVEALVPLRKAAWNALPSNVRERFVQETRHFGKVEI